MSAKESVQQLKDFFKKNPRFLFIGIMVILLILRVYIYIFESKLTTPVPPVPTPAVLTKVVDRESEIYTKVQQMIVPLPEFEESFVEDLAADNMFDPRVVLEAQGRERRAQQLQDQAIQARTLGNNEEAYRLAQEVLKLQERNVVARRLVDELAPLVAPGAGPADAAETPPVDPDSAPEAAPETAPEATPEAGGQ